MDADERVRRQAVRRVLGGERVADVAVALGRTERWLFKWVSRYDPADAGWALERSRAPAHVPARSDPKIEALVLQVRARLAAQPWSQIGAPAIAWELEKRHLRTIPELRTIERILERGDVPRRLVRSRYVAKGTPYPAAAQRPAPNTLQEADLVGPRHLSGGDPLLRLQRRRRGPARGGLRAAAEQKRRRDGRLAGPHLVPPRDPRAAQARQLAGRHAPPRLAPHRVALPGARGDPGIRARPGAVAPGDHRALQ